MGKAAQGLREFWDERAREDAFFFRDDRLAYGAPDVERVCAQGERDLDALLEAAGARVRPDDDVLDVGCGLGGLTRALAARGRSVRALTLGYVRDTGRVLRPGGWAAVQTSNDPAIRRARKAQADPRWLGSAVDLDRLTAGAGAQYCIVRLARR